MFSLNLPLHFTLKSWLYFLHHLIYSQNITVFFSPKISRDGGGVTSELTHLPERISNLTGIRLVGDLVLTSLQFKMYLIFGIAVWWFYLAG